MTGATRRRWTRRILFGVAALAVLVVGASWAFIRLQPTLPPLALPTAPAGAPVGPLDGTWAVSAGSVAGFRVPETAFGMSNEVVGRTTAVSGTIVLAGDRVTVAMFRIGLAGVEVNGKAQPQFARILNTRRFPDATFTLARPVAVGSAPGGAGAAAGQLGVNGVTRPVTVTISWRRDGAALEVTGTIPVAFTAWDIRGPAGYGFFGSLADHGVAEFLLTLHRV